MKLAILLVSFVLFNLEVNAAQEPAQKAASDLLEQNFASMPATNAARLREYLRQKRTDPSWDWKQPISFYGRVVDEKNNPIGGAAVDLGWNDLSENGTSEVHTNSDVDGSFSLLNRSGKLLSVRVSKAGYYSTSDASQAFEYANPEEKSFFVPDARKPVAFHLRKRGEGADLTQKVTEMTVAVGKVLSVRLDEQAELQVELLRNGPAHPNEWAARVKTINGGIQPALEEFPFQAPLEGYVSQLELTANSPKPPKWSTLYQGGEFYVKTPTGYGRIKLQMIARRPYMRATAFLNPTGSRNLEPR